MQERHTQEMREWEEQVAKQVEEGVDEILREMAADLATATDSANAALNQALEEFFAKEAEAIDQIDEMDWTMEGEVDWMVLRTKKRVTHWITQSAVAGTDAC